MSDLLDSVLRAHGGLDRRRTFQNVSAMFVSGGGLMPMKGIKVTPKPLEGTATIRYESTVISPFGQSDWRMVFTPERVVVETVAGEIVQERSNPRAAFAGHTLSTEWDLLQHAYCPLDVPQYSVSARDAGLRGNRNRALE